MHYLVNSPWILRKFFPSLTWHIEGKSKTIYLSFDDGPHPTATPFVLDQLKRFDAKGTFFCIGKNVEQYPAIYQRILDEGHSVGNHTHSHMNGWKNSDEDYLENILEAKKIIGSNLFRPPYGKIKRSQIKMLGKEGENFKVVMWSVLSGDFDTELDPDKCLNNVIRNAEKGSIVVFHDSEKAWPRLSYALPLVLSYFQEKGFRFSTIPL